MMKRQEAFGIFHPGSRRPRPLTVGLHHGKIFMEIEKRE
jgi:hypothetical protein